VHGAERARRLLGTLGVTQMITALLAVAVAVTIGAALIYWYACAVAERTSRPAVQRNTP
jgi:arginine exporter protein ArgO